MIRPLAISGFALMLALIACVPFFFQASAATTFETVVGECKKRTGFSDATCKTLVKKYINVERCKEYTGSSDEECAKKIEEIRKDPEFSGVQSSPDLPVTTVPLSVKNPVLNPRNTGTVAVLREKKGRDLIELRKRTEALMITLKSKGVDTDSIEAALPEFERNAEALLSAYDAYQAVYDRTRQDATETRRAFRLDARDRVGQARRILIEQYETRILSPLRAASEQTL
ncbi:MAG: hypothetical protein E6Q06_04735 [Candidatus Moraniibacteriota bacterium]|nr:MAG: hypothetical protein E6Q06_04735 [Candidatus Moranbacteria bacterium]